MSAALALVFTVTTLEGVALATRDMAAADRPFVRRTWIESYRKRSVVEPDVYDVEMPRLVDDLLDGSRSIVAYREAMPDVVHAFAIGAPGICLHYAYTAGVLRMRGISRQLAHAVTGLRAPMQMTCRGPGLLNRYVFNPFLLRQPL